MSEELLKVVRNVSRVMALHRSGLLDTPPEETYDRFTRLAAHTLKTPISLLSLVDTDRQFFKSARGLAEPWASWRGTPLSYSFCKGVVETGSALIVQDARAVAELRENRLVEELGVLAYAGMPVRSSEGHILGTLCVLDEQPRAWTSADLMTLRDLADCVTQEIGLRTHLREAESARRAVEARLHVLQQSEGS